MKLLSTIAIDEHARQPKYRQIVDRIIECITSGKLQLNEKIPSINQFSEEFDLSRDTVEKAYNILKERAIITSVKGKGFYVTSTPRTTRSKVLFLVNKLSVYKMRIYHSFIAGVGKDVHTELHIYHCDENIFLDHLENNCNTYDYYVIMPHFKTERLKHVSSTVRVKKALACIPKHKLLILDNHLDSVTGKYAEVYQDFEDDIYQALTSGIEKIRKYEHLVIAYPSQSVYPYPKRILLGFRKFCVEAKLSFAVIEEIEEDFPLLPGTLYLTIQENDLVNLVKSARDQGLKPGNEIGIISYNETPLKDLLGITTISTDFDAMGKITASMMLEGKREKVRNRFVLTDRASH